MIERTVNATRSSGNDRLTISILSSSEIYSSRRSVAVRAIRRPDLHNLRLAIETVVTFNCRWQSEEDFPRHFDLSIWGGNRSRFD
jgi:hypothetical protein